MHGFSDRGIRSTIEARDARGRFGRLFPEVPSAPIRGLEHAVLYGDGENGLMSAAREGAENPDAESITAGVTFLGQFLDHDITLEITSELERQADPDATHNFRTPALELDSVYGLGPDVQPYLYDPNRFGRILIGDQGNDLQRNRNNVAMIGDARNDENMLIGQLHLLFIKFHNKVLDGVHSGEIKKDARGYDIPEGLSDKAKFRIAQQLVRWHYQWMIVNEYLPTVCGEYVVDSILSSGRRFYHFEGDPFIPVEFSVAAFRFGHSQVRGGYRVNNHSEPLPLFDPTATGGERQDLQGGRPVTDEFVVEWGLFFDLTGDCSDAIPSKSIDEILVKELLNLPGSVVPGATNSPLSSLATRNILRGETLGLPAGEEVAERMGEPVLSPRDLGLSGGATPPTPLWYYLLRESKVRAGGRHLGPVGGRIVAEVFIGLLEGDIASYLTVARSWKPTLTKSGRFTMADMVRFVD